jgi:hypothetical protein
MNLRRWFAAMPAALLVLGNGVANAGQTIDEAGAFACVTDKWDETEPEKGHKLVDMAARCVTISAEPAAPKYTTDCVGKYEFMPDESCRVVEPALGTLRVETRCTKPSRRVRTSKSTRTKSPVAPANTKVPLAAARI